MAAAADPARRGELSALLREEHPDYAGRGAAAISRMRGWVLLALARVGLTDDTLPFVLEELATGQNPYLVAAAARALRSYPSPDSGLAPFVLDAIDARGRDDSVSLAGYGGSGAGSSPVAELLAALAWLGPHAAAELPRVEALAAAGSGLAERHRAEAGGIAAALRSVEVPRGCCADPPSVHTPSVWDRARRADSRVLDRLVFEDQDGAAVPFAEFFRGRPAVVVFFYTRCDNPGKCSLTVTKLARVQQLLAARGLADRVRTAAITYDPGYDHPERLRRYGVARGFQPGAGHRLLRADDEFEALRRHFRLGVNYAGSVVNRHRIEVFVLDARGRVAAAFERLHWAEQDVVGHAAALASEGVWRGWTRGVASTLATAAAVGAAFFPKCPACWAAYLSLFGMAGLQGLAYPRGFCGCWSVRCW